MLRCGSTSEDPRVAAALAWLRSHVNGAGHVGDYPPERAGDRAALDFYFAWSVAQVLTDVPSELAKAWPTALTAGIGLIPLVYGGLSGYVTTLSIQNTSPAPATARAEC